MEKSDNKIAYSGLKTAKGGHKNETSSQCKIISNSTVYRRRKKNGGPRKKTDTMNIDIHTKIEPSEGANIPDSHKGETKVLINITEIQQNI